MGKLPSPWSIICTDNACWGITTSTPMILFIALVIKFTGTMPGGRGKPDVPVDPEFANLVLAGAVALTLLLSAIVARRVARIRRLFEEGREVEANVREVKRFRGGSTLKLEFELNGILYKASSTFQRWLRTPAFSEGTRIRVLVDPINPKRAVPRALYEDSDGAQSLARPISPEPRGGSRSRRRLALSTARGIGDRARDDR